MLNEQRRTADVLAMEVDIHLNAVGDLDERNATVHPVVFAVKGHYPLDVVYACAEAGNRQQQGLGFRDSAYRKDTLYVKGVWTGLNNFGRMERDVRVILDVEEIFALQLAILHAASGVDAGRLSLDVQNACRDVRRCKRQGGVPLIKFTGDSD